MPRVHGPGLVAITAVVLSACRQGETPVPKSAAQAKFVDARLCAGCHAEIARSYRETAMAHAFGRATEANVTPGEFAHALSGRRYRIARRDGGRFVMERTAHGEFRDEMSIDFVMGSGSAARSYLHLSPQGRLYELPVAWYAENGGTLAMSPGYDRHRHFDMARRVSYDCLFCHNGYPAIDAASERAGAEPLFAPDGAMPEGIDCQRCHGPGSLHAASPNTAGLIVNPKKLDAARRMEVCLQCHLETTSFALPNSIVRYERGPFSYRAGESLGDFMLHFDHAPGSGREDKFEIVSAAYRLRQSRCFAESGEAKLTCTTCHDPHTAAKPTAMKAVCEQCHPPARRVAGHPAAGDCARCHMPKRRTEDVVHAVVTDHRIARRYPDGLTRPMSERHETGARKYRGEVVLYYPPQLAPGPARDLYLATVQVKQASNPERGREQLAAAIERHKPTGPEFYFDLAQADFQAGRTDEAIGGFTRALERDRLFVPARRNLGAALLRAGRTAEAISVLSEGRAAKPCDAALLNELGRALAASGRAAEARPVAEEALRCDERMAEAHNTLGGILLALGDAAGAEAEVRRAVELDPDLGEAVMNLGAMAGMRGDRGRARRLLERAAASGSAEVQAQARRYLAQLGF